MNDLELTLTNVDQIIEEARRDDLSIAEKAGLYAATHVIARDLDKHIDEECGGDGYAHEKVGTMRWHVGAALGFDVTNNHSAEEHTVWALGALNSLRNVLRQRGKA
jgi:hypothetical protein